MVFSSLIFLYGFLPASLLVYFLCPSMKAKNVSLLVFSLIFYAWGEPKYVILLAFMALADWFFALRVEEKRKCGGRGKGWLAGACIVDLGLLAFFKYSGMICSVFSQVPAFVEKIALPIGISFYTFQLLTYVIDVYRGEARAQKKYWHVLLYASLFHQCIAGPIVRYQTVERELFTERNCSDLPAGVQRFSVGLAKKVLLANPCGSLADRYLLADSVLADVSAAAENLQMLSTQPALGSWLGIAAFSLQIYFDFSAYSDMAIGMGKMLGLHYLENFNYPYVSRTVGEFWRRWHISLGSFFRDYVYIPLGGNRRGAARTFFNLLAVWALTGLWHGASWNFVLWGLYFFVFLALERLFLGKWMSSDSAIGKIVSHIYLPIVVLFGWILFKYSDLKLVGVFLRSLFGGNGNAAVSFESVTELKSHIFLLAFCIPSATPVFRSIGRAWAAKGEESLFMEKSYQAFAYGILPVILLLLSTAGLVGNL